MFSCIKFDVSVLLLSVSSFVVCQNSVDYSSLYENVVCNTYSYFACQRISNCPSALEDIINGGRPNICSFDGNEPLVCCDMRRTTRLQQGNVDMITIVSDPTKNTLQTNVQNPWQNPFGQVQNSAQNPSGIPFGRQQSNTQNPTANNPARMTRESTRLWFTTTPPPPIPGIENTKSVQKCQEYGEICPKPSSAHAAGGLPANPKQFPHMALIGTGPENDKSWRCGGSVISRRYILSAAHCTFVDDSMGFAKWVRLGELDHSSTSEDANHEDYTIIEWINHPHYNPPQIYNDIALYKVDRDIVFNGYIQPICLHTTLDISERDGKATGWGRIEFAGPMSNHLLYININFVNPEKCKDNLQNRLSKSLFPDGLRTDSFVCAGEADGSKDTCQGDSGGPLFIHQEYPWPSCLFKQVGITSVGLPCGQENTPGLYTRVSSYIPWIESIVWENDP